MSDNELTETQKAIIRNAERHDHSELVRRNGVWGTCVECPRADGKIYPERCKNFDRPDHQLRPLW